MGDVVAGGGQVGGPGPWTAGSVPQAQESAARDVLLGRMKGAHEVVEDREDDLCLYCYRPIIYAVRKMVQGWKTEAVEAQWIDAEHRTSLCVVEEMARGMHKPAKVPEGMDADEVRAWLEA